MKNRVNIQASNGFTMKTDCSKTMHVLAATPDARNSAFSDALCLLLSQ